MNDTLLVLCTHFVDKAIISEYEKMKNTPNVDVVLAIDNSNYKRDISKRGRIEDVVFFETEVHCFFFDSALHEELMLPYFTFSGIENFNRVMWHNGDYRFYYLKKYFPDYQYYWTFDYDVFCNSNTYQDFLNKYNKLDSDFLSPNFRVEKKDGPWCWSHGMNWIYGDLEIYGSFFPVVRLSSKAIDFLYERRLEHKRLYQMTADLKHWPLCELFVPTELMNNGFSCGNLSEEKHLTLEPIYLNDERIFTKPDSHLYHPVKSTRNEISRLKQDYDNLSTLFRKVFLTQFIQRLIETTSVNLTEFPINCEEEFRYLIIPLVEDFGLRYEVHLSTNTVYLMIGFEDKYVDARYTNVVKELEKLNGLAFNAVRGSTGGGYKIFCSLKNIDDISFVVYVMKIIVESTYHILKSKPLTTE